MARVQSRDPLQKFRFHAEAYLNDGTDGLKYTDESGAQAGFNSITVPELTIEAVEYKEGTDTYKRRYPGAPTWSDTITLSRGVAKRDTVFYSWIVDKVLGGLEYRADMTIYHFHRDGNKDISKARLYTCYEAFPARVKLADDLDATGSDVSLQEIDINYEWAELTAAS